MSEHKFPFKWYLKDGYPAKGIECHNTKVFGTFICGGGSTMGYKLAGYSHLGGVEIDEQVAEIYTANHHPKYIFRQDIRDFVERTDLPDELFSLDLLDGSPPCSSFSMAGNREKDWNKQKVFREGQAHQKLDDLFFTYIRLAKILQPKVVIAENVKGLIQGNAKFYVSRIKKEFENAGYKVQLFLLNAGSMGVPQRRERVFFICQRNDMNFPELKLEFNEPEIPFSAIDTRIEEGKMTDCALPLWTKCKPGYSFSTVHERGSWFNATKIDTAKSIGTITSVTASGGQMYHPEFPRFLSDIEYQQAGTFPIDYDFKNIHAKYLIGMSVPPVMTAQVAHQIYLQWLKK